MIEIIATAAIAGPLGFLTCAFLTAGKVADASQQWDDWELTAVGLTDDLFAAQDAHTRATDALNSTRARIERALEQVTPGANATVQRIARILRGAA